jgi:hypothetical protein
MLGKWLHWPAIGAVLLAAALCSPVSAQGRQRQRQTMPTQPLQADGEQDERPISTRCYLVHSQLPPEQLPGVLRHLDRMALEYARRTAGLSRRADDRKLPLYLFAREEDFRKAGGPPNTSGIFDGERLLACIGRNADARAWHIIQHEAFHQFLTAKLGYELPIWMHEGLAEYFGEGVYTGDDFVLGVVPPYRLKRVQEELRLNGTGLADLIGTSHEAWNQNINQRNYDLAWSLVHFLAHAEDGAYQQSLEKFVKASAGNEAGLKMFERTVGPAETVEKQWRQFWLDYPDEQVKRTYGQVAVQTLCSYGARANLAGVKITSVDQFNQIVAAGNFRQPPGDTLATEPLEECLAYAPKLGQWQFDFTGRAGFNVQLRVAEGSALTARAIIRNGAVEAVEWSNGSSRNSRSTR